MTSLNDPTSAGDAQTTSRIVVGLFQERARAEEAIRDLKKAGFSDEQIGFDAAFREGGTLVTVNAGDRTPEAVSAMERAGADLGPWRTGQAGRPSERAASSYQGSERRLRQEASYSGPERRLVGV